jgi:hypothetical protein
LVRIQFPPQWCCMHLQMMPKSGHGNDPQEENHFPLVVHMVRLSPELIFVKQVRQTSHSFGKTPQCLTQEYSIATLSESTVYCWV